jgi:hypothetical protein
MSYVLLNRAQGGRPEPLKTYSTHKGAVIGMRASNRNAGWHRYSLCSTSWAEMEWCSNSNKVYDYAPYIIMHEKNYQIKYPALAQVFV